MHHTLTITPEHYDNFNPLLSIRFKEPYVTGDILHVTKEATREQKSFTITNVITGNMYKGWCALQLAPVADGHAEVVEALSGSHGASILEETK